MPGDQVLTFDGKLVTIKSDLERHVLDLALPSITPLRLVRDGVDFNVNIRLGVLANMRQ